MSKRVEKEFGGKQPGWVEGFVNKSGPDVSDEVAVKAICDEMSQVSGLASLIKEKVQIRLPFIDGAFDDAFYMTASNVPRENLETFKSALERVICDIEGLESNEFEVAFPGQTITADGSHATAVNKKELRSENDVEEFVRTIRP